MYDANVVAKYIVDYCMKNHSPVTNLKLQKILYYLWIDYYKEKKEYLFGNSIIAWPLGPVVIDVYAEFCAYGGFPIRKQYSDLQIDKEDQHLLDSTLAKLLPYSAHKLVDLSHAKGKPWDKIFLNGTGRDHPIPFEMIIEDECS